MSILFYLFLTVTMIFSMEGQAKNVEPVELKSLAVLCGGIKPADMISALADEYQATVTIAGQPVKLFINADYAGGKILCFPPVKAPPGSMRPDRLERVEVEVRVSFKTSDGLFDESFNALLKGGSAGSSLVGSLKPDQLKGKFKPQLIGYEKTLINFEIRFTGKDCMGTLSKSGRKPGRANERIPVFRWNSIESK